MPPVFQLTGFTQLSVQPLGFAQLWQSVGPAGLGIRRLGFFLTCPPRIPRAVPVECGPRSSRAHAAAAPKQRSAGGKQPDRRQLRRLLRARRQRPPGYGAAKQRDELTTPHSKTSSVRSVCRQRTSAASSGDDPRLYPYRVLWCVEPPHCASMVYSFSREYCFNDFRSPFVHSFRVRFVLLTIITP